VQEKLDHQDAWDLMRGWRWLDVALSAVRDAGEVRLA
jgi:hypothetical protein